VRSTTWIHLACALALTPGACTIPNPHAKLALDGGLADAGEDGLADQLAPDLASSCEDPDGDADGDKIPNATEGCDVDTDGDKVPDYLDKDADSDKIADSIEAGQEGQCNGPSPKIWPCDSDGDGVADFRDTDSDGDGLLDREEDPSADGVVGCCLGQCTAASPPAACPALGSDGCSAGQTCQGGTCSPQAAWLCSAGETDPTLADTFGDGITDDRRGTEVCRPASAANPHGSKKLLIRKNLIGDYQVALDPGLTYTTIKIPGAAGKVAAATMDDSSGQAEVAGFLISRPATLSTVHDELAAVLADIRAEVPATLGTVSLVASGTTLKTHDRYDAVSGTTLRVLLVKPSNVSDLRGALLGGLLGKAPSTLGNLPGAFGSNAVEFIVRLGAVRRFAFKKNANGKVVVGSDGYPVDDGDKTSWRLVLMGAVAGAVNYDSDGLETAAAVDDLAGGTGLATFADKLAGACEPAAIDRLPEADIIWVVDESGSMADSRDTVVKNATTFFTRAVNAGLDFRMGVTNVCSPYGAYKSIVGKLCSKASTDVLDSGGTDRFLLPGEQSTFSACVKNPPGYEGGQEYGLVNAVAAIKNHLPRASGSTSAIRPDATLAVIVVSDEVPQGMSTVIGSYNKKCALSGTKQTALTAALKPAASLLSGATDPEAEAALYVVGGVCGNACKADVAHGYRELAVQLGGQTGDVCQSDLGRTLQRILDGIVGRASPVVLSRVPVSASLVVAMDGKALERSRSGAGYDFDPAANSLVFRQLSYAKGSRVIASYRYWAGP
jgi:hypothetical protein